MHEHSHCKHSLEYCKVCDVVYCTKCGKEWGNGIFYYRSVPQWWTYNNEGNFTVGATINTHTHEEGG